MANRNAIRIELFLNIIDISRFREYLDDDGVNGIDISENGFGGEMTEARVYGEFGVVGVETKWSGRERAKYLRLFRDFVVSAEKKMENAALMSHCCEERNEGLRFEN